MIETNVALASGFSPMMTFSHGRNVNNLGTRHHVQLFAYRPSGPLVSRRVGIGTRQARLCVPSTNANGNATSRDLEVDEARIEQLVEGVPTGRLRLVLIEP